MSVIANVSRFERVRSLLKQAAAGTVQAFGGLELWSMSRDQLIAAKLMGLSLIKLNKPAHSCCHPSSTTSDTGGSALVSGLRGIAPFDDFQFPRLPWGRPAMIENEVEEIAAWIADGAPASDVGEDHLQLPRKRVESLYDQNRDLQRGRKRSARCIRRIRGTDQQLPLPEWSAAAAHEHRLYEFAADRKAALCLSRDLLLVGPGRAPFLPGWVEQSHWLIWISDSSERRSSCRGPAQVSNSLKVLDLREQPLCAPKWKRGRCPQRQVETISILGVALLRSRTFVL